MQTSFVSTDDFIQEYLLEIFAETEPTAFAAAAAAWNSIGDIRMLALAAELKCWPTASP